MERLIKALKIKNYEISRLEKVIPAKRVKCACKVICFQKFNTFGNSLCSLVQPQIMGEKF
jgi:hypothetical protein